MSMVKRIIPLVRLLKTSDPLQVSVEMLMRTYCLYGNRVTADIVNGHVCLDKESWANQEWTRFGRNKFLKMYGVVPSNNTDNVITRMITKGEIKLIDLN